MDNNISKNNNTSISDGISSHEDEKSDENSISTELAPPATGWSKGAVPSSGWTSNSPKSAPSSAENKVSCSGWSTKGAAPFSGWAYSSLAADHSISKNNSTSISDDISSHEDENGDKNNNSAKNAPPATAVPCSGWTSNSQQSVPYSASNDSSGWSTKVVAPSPGWTSNSLATDSKIPKNDSVSTSNDISNDNSSEITPPAAGSWSKGMTQSSGWTNNLQKLVPSSASNNFSSWPAKVVTPSPGWNSNSSKSVQCSAEFNIVSSGWPTVSAKEATLSSSWASRSDHNERLLDSDVAKFKADHPGTAKYNELLVYFVGDALCHSYLSVARNVLSRLKRSNPPARIFKIDGKSECLVIDELNYIIRDLSALFRSNKKNGVAMEPSGEDCNDDNSSILSHDANNSVAYSQQDKNGGFKAKDGAQFGNFPVPMKSLALPAGKRAKDLCLLPDKEFNVPVLRNSENGEYFLKWLWGERLLIKECKLDKSLLMEIEFVKYGTRYALVATKPFDSKSMQFTKFDQKWIRAYYVALDEDDRDFSSSLALKKQLDKLGDFGKLETKKVVSRFELMVSPAVKGPGRATLHYELSKDDFEMISENYNDGCGFVPESAMRDKFGLDPAAVSAIQVRIMCPKLGWFKGMETCWICFCGILLICRK